MVIPTIPAWLKYRQINTENLEKAKAVGTPISEPKQEHITKPAGISTVNPMVPGEAPGQPPRPGLEWNPGTHRWVSSNRGMGGFGGDEGEGGGYPIQEDTEAEQLVKDFNDKLKAEFARGDSEDHWCHAYVFSEFLKHHKVNANSLARGSEAIIQMIDEEGNSTFIDPINDNFEPTEDVTTLVSDAIGIYKYGWITLKESVKDEELLKRTDQLVTDIEEDLLSLKRTYQKSGSKRREVFLNKQVLHQDLLRLKDWNGILKVIGGSDLIVQTLKSKNM
jgi:hypothetical protein